MKVREATLNDLESIIRLWKEFASEHSMQDIRLRYKSDFLEERYKRFKSKMISPNNISLVIEDDQSYIRGYLLSHIEDMSEFAVSSMNLIGYIDSFYVEKGHRHKRYGKSLLDSLMQRLKNKGIKYVFIKILAQNTEAQEYFKKQGFEPINIIYAREIK